jgi:hypothetical protein
MRALTSTRTYSPFRLRLPAPTVAACRHHSRLANVHLHPTLQALRFACASVQHTAGLAPSAAATASRASAKYSHTLRRACRLMAAPSLVAPTALSAPGNRPRSGLRLCSLTPARKRLQGVSSWSQTPPSSPSLPPHPRPLFMKTCAFLTVPPASPSPPFHENHRLAQNSVPITLVALPRFAPIWRKLDSDLSKQQLFGAS